MKPSYSAAFLALLGTGLLTQCEKSSDRAATTKAPSTVAAVAKTAPAAVKSDLPLKKIEVTANDQMKFSVTQLEAGPGQPLEVTFRNAGTMPKASMGHNWVLLIKGADPDKLAENAFTAAGNDYIPPDMEDQVITRTKILGPGESETLTFNAPSEPGDYVFYCSFPGHLGIGMKGLLTIK
ncbi:plastocyanin/azurin family copper-binding protein [Haloferula sargassicola]|uniref:Blue (type 1) copper domain-containing protein n=1 Tax=Haloferula sargassicola TaxID=490096 RepID=A0ABP9UMN1_9BACT